VPAAARALKLGVRSLAGSHAPLPLIHASSKHWPRDTEASPSPRTDRTHISPPPIQTGRTSLHRSVQTRRTPLPGHRGGALETSKGSKDLWKPRGSCGRRARADPRAARGKGTRRVQLVRRDGRDVSTLYGRGGTRDMGRFFFSTRDPRAAERAATRAEIPHTEGLVRV